MPVQTLVAAPLRGRLADAVDLMIQLADEVAVVPGVLIPPARVRPVAALVSSIKPITERAGTPTHVLHEIHELHYPHSRWGINE